MMRRRGVDDGEHAIRIATAFMELTSRINAPEEKDLNNIHSCNGTHQDEGFRHGEDNSSTKEPHSSVDSLPSQNGGFHENGSYEGGTKKQECDRRAAMGNVRDQTREWASCSHNGNGHGNHENWRAERMNGGVKLEGGGLLFPNAFGAKGSHDVGARVDSTVNNGVDSASHNNGWIQGFDSASAVSPDKADKESFLARREMPAWIKKLTVMDAVVIFICITWFCSVIPHDALILFLDRNVLMGSRSSPFGPFMHGIVLAFIVSLVVVPGFVAFYVLLVQIGLYLSYLSQRARDPQSADTLQFKQLYSHPNASKHKNTFLIFRLIVMATFSLSVLAIIRIYTETNFTELLEKDVMIGCVGRCLIGMNSGYERIISRQLYNAENERDSCLVREKSLENQIHHMRSRIRTDLTPEVSAVGGGQSHAISLKGVPPRLTAAFRRAMMEYANIPAAAQRESLEPQDPNVAPVAYPVLDELAQAMGTETDRETRARAGRIKAAFEYAWMAYEGNAFGWDELKPISKKGMNILGLGITIVDSLDSMLVMGMQDTGIYLRARDWVREFFNPEPLSDVSVFETTIRILGGLLSAFALSGDELYRSKAVLLADRLLNAFETNTGIPSSVLNLKEGIYKRILHNPFNGQTYNFGDSTTIAEAGSLQLELHYLSHITGNKTYGEKGDAAISRILSIGKQKKGPAAALRLAHVQDSDQHELVDITFPVDVHPREGRFTTERVSMGSGGDSFYEYLLKQFIMMPRSKKKMRYLYEDVVVAALARVRGVQGSTVFIGESTKEKSRPSNKMEHLSCFVPGMLALGHTVLDSPAAEKHLQDARDIMVTCMNMYQSTRTGLAAEHYDVTGGRSLQPSRSGKYSLLRPEAVESAFVLWRVTKDPVYRDFGWSVFLALEKHSKITNGGGYSAIEDVQVDAGGAQTQNRLDRMDSFLLSETFKYLYLLFSPDAVLPLDRYVFNTEAHPFPVLESRFP